MKEEVTVRLNNALQLFNLTLEEALNIDPEKLKEIRFGSKNIIELQKLYLMIPTLEEHFLGKIKEVLLFNNDAQAIRFMEKYYQAKKDQDGQ